MKFLSLFATPLLAIGADAFKGQLVSYGQTQVTSTKAFERLQLNDYWTGSTYAASILGGFDNCVDKKCSLTFVETSPGGYDFDARVWKTKDGCYNIDFDDAFGGAGHGWCCGQLPCDIVTKG